MMTTSTCYACNNLASSEEHAPPKCFFPTAEEFPDGHGRYRENLITVPSCDEHNNRRSSDDEYTACQLAMSAENSSVAWALFQGPRLRAMTRREASLGTRIFASARPMTTIDGQNTFALNVELSRIKRVVDHIAKALYFKHFDRKWSEEITTICPRFLRDSLALDLLGKAKLFSSHMDALHRTGDARGAVHGAHPEVFWYQILDFAEGRPFVRMTFYESFEFLVLGYS